MSGGDVCPDPTLKCSQEGTRLGWRALDTDLTLPASSDGKGSCAVCADCTVLPRVLFTTREKEKLNKMKVKHGSRWPDPQTASTESVLEMKTKQRTTNPSKETGSEPKLNYTETLSANKDLKDSPDDLQK